MRFDFRMFTFSESTNTFVAEASTLGLRPGMSPPRQFELMLDRGTSRGKFHFSRPDTRGGELQGWYYTGANGDRALIIND